jgi:uncharacterized protein YlxP (DUF503 family)
LPRRILFGTEYLVSIPAILQSVAICRHAVLYLGTVTPSIQATSEGKMKTSVTVVQALSFAGMLVLGIAAFSNAHGKVQTATQEVSKVIISARHFTEEEKNAYDIEQKTGIQTVVISAKRQQREQNLALTKSRAAFRNEVSI